MKFDALSALVGAGSLAGVLFTVSAFQTPVGSSPIQERWSPIGFTLDGPVQIQGIPAPSQMVRLDEGSVLDVPPGQIFVATGTGTIGATTGINTVDVLFDGNVVFQTNTDVADGAGNTVAIPAGVSAGAGVAVQVNGSGQGVLLGYLADE
ncbi:MAG: hypothetical protein AAF682_01610 [Planctomycetota bacterium]